MSEASSVWLDAWEHPVADIHAYSRCMALANVAGDNDYRLLVANENKRLKIYRGTTLESEHVILDVPSALCSYYMDQGPKELPAVAIASGACIFIYRNLRPYFKFTLPPLDIHPKEEEIWQDIVDSISSGSGEQIEFAPVMEQLVELRDVQGVMLTPRSADMLTLSTRDAQLEFSTIAADHPLRHSTTITCMSVLSKTIDEEASVGCLVLGLEVKQLMILSPDAHTIIAKVRLPSVPAFMCCTGTFSVEYRVFVACRHSVVCTVKNGELLKQRIELEYPPSCMITVDKSLLVGGAKTIQAFTHKGKRKWSLYLQAAVCEIEAVHAAGAKGSSSCFVVALSNGEVQLYNQRQLLDKFSVGERMITALKFGSYGREDGSLALAYKSGGLTLKIMPRHANLDVTNETAGPPPEQDIPLNVPKKTKLYVEQTKRERLHATEMHRTFQRDLCKLRLDTARSYVKIITDGQGPMSYTSGSSIRLSAQVQGLGALFSIKILVQNTGTKPIFDINLVATFNQQLYKVERPHIPVPVLVPGLQYKYHLDILCIDEDGSAEPVQVYVCGSHSVVPMISAIVNMPLSDIILGDE